MSNGWLDELPWATNDMKKELGVHTRSGRKKMNMWESAPNLNFDFSNDAASAVTFDEPDFSKSLANLSYDMNDEMDEDDARFSADPFAPKKNAFQTSSRNKAKPNHQTATNMPIKEREIVDLFSQWKQKTKDEQSPFSPTSDKKSLSPKKSPTIKVIRKGKAKTLSKLASCPPSFNDTGGGSQTRSPSKSPTKRKKKVAVKLKACDLNLSKSKQEEIEKMFWKWKGVQDPGSSAGLPDPNEDRWKDESRAISAARPKPASRQASVDLEDKVPIEKAKPLRASTRDQQSQSRARSRSSSTDSTPEKSFTPCYERSKDDRHRSSSREKSTTRGDSSGESSEERRRSGRTSSRESISGRERSKSRGSRSRVTKDPEERQRSSTRGTRERSKSRGAGPREGSNQRANSSGRERRPRSKSRSKSDEQMQGEATETYGRSKSTMRRPSYIRRARSSESVERTPSAGRRGSGDEAVQQCAFPL